MDVRLILAPYDSGQHLRRMGCGPDRLLQAGLAEALDGAGHGVALHRLEVAQDFPSEIGGSFAVMRAVAEAVVAAREADTLPIVLAGNCDTTVGVVAGAGVEGTGVLWLDAHGDINTPDSTETGYLDGMGVAILTGRAWQALARSIPGFRPLADERVILAGVRDLDAVEVELLRRSQVRVLADSAIRQVGAATALAAPLAALAAIAEHLHLHLDLDVHDAEVAPANQYRPPGGLTPQEVGEAVEAATARLPLRSMAVTAYDPAVDPDGVTAKAAVGHVCRAVAGAAGAASARRRAQSRLS